MNNSMPRLQWIGRAVIALVLLTVSTNQLLSQNSRPKTKTDVYSIFSVPADELSWPALDSLGIGWVRLQHQMGEVDPNRAFLFFSRVLEEGYGLWLTLHHRERENIAEVSEFDASERGSFPPADSVRYMNLVRSCVKPLLDLLVSQGKNPAEWLVIQFSNEVIPKDVLPPSPIRFFHGTSDEYLSTLSYTRSAVKSLDADIPISIGGISSGTLEIILDFSTDPADSLKRKIVDWNDRLLAEAQFDWVDIHLYHTIERIPDKVAWIRQRWSGPIASTECGGPDENTGVTYTEESQAQQLPDRINTALEAGVDRVFWAALRDRDIPGDRLAQTLGLLAIDWRFKEAYSVYRDLIASAVTSVDETRIPQGFSLSQNYPNPFNPQTTIRFSLNRTMTATLRVFNVLGREEMTLVQGLLNGGEHSVVLDGALLSSGVYFYRLETEEFSQTRKLVLVR